MSTASASTARPIVGLGLTEGVAAQLARDFDLLQPPGGFDPTAPVIVVQNARVDAAKMARQPGAKFIAVFGAGSTHETWDEASALLIRNLGHFFTTGRPLTPVTL
jgi:hypothetical protein